MNWVLRPIVWFTAASMLTTVLHELAHACAAYVLGVRSTLFNYSANLDLTATQAASNLPALIRVAGPSFCLAMGLFAWLAYRRARGALPLLYLSVFGLGTFFGNLMSTSFVGDFSSVATALNLPWTVRYAATAAGAFSLAAIHFWAGRELVQRVPSHAGKVVAVFGIIVLPVMLGTGAVILANMPMPRASVNARVAEASFWVFAAIGALAARRHIRDESRSLELRWVDGVVTLFAVLAVRLMVRGIPFIP